MAPAGETRIQLCGRFVVRLDGRRVEDALAGAKGQLLFAYLVLNRFRRIRRDELLDAVYGEEGMPDHYPRLSVLLSKLRRVVGPELLAGRSQIDVVLPPDAFVDVEAALDGLHRAESHVAAAEWAEAWGPRESPTTWPTGRCSRATTARGSTSGGDAWTTFACVGWSASRQPGSASVDRRCRRPRSAARQLIALAPYRESGYRILMEALAQRGNVAEALLVYDRLRVLVREELGIAPSPAVQSVHRRLLGEASRTSV